MKPRDIEDAQAIITTVVALMVAIAKAFEEIQMGLKIPIPALPMKPEQPKYCKETSCGKQLPSIAELDRLFKSDYTTWCVIVDGFCCFDCQDWHRQIKRGAK